MPKNMTEDAGDISFDDMVSSLVEEAPAEEAPAEEAPAEEVPAEEVPAEEVPAEEAPKAKRSARKKADEFDDLPASTRAEMEAGRAALLAKMGG